MAAFGGGAEGVMIADATHRLPFSIKRFPGLHTGLLARKRVYLDNACLTPVPAEVVDAVHAYYLSPPACPLRNNSSLSEGMEGRVRDARESIRRFLNARFSDEIIFTPNTTFGINLLSSAFASIPGKVMISDLEHNSNRLPWLHHERVELPWPPGQPFPFDAYCELLREGVKLVSLTALSNVTGASLPVGDVVREARKHGIPVHLDAAQAFAGGGLDVTETQPDFISFSLHKAYGPSGLGGLYMRRDWRAKLAPVLAGAGSVDDHFNDTSEWLDGAGRFEFGLQNYAAISAVPAAMAVLSSASPAAIRGHYAQLGAALREELKRVPGIKPVSPASPEESHHIYSFHLPGSDAKRLSSLLDMVGNFQVRAGKLCAHHWFHRHEVPDVVRVSFGFHNSIEEVEQYGRIFDKIVKHYL